MDIYISCGSLTTRHCKTINRKEKSKLRSALLLIRNSVHTESEQRPVFGYLIDKTSNGILKQVETNLQ